MPDVHTPEVRSRNMSAVRGKDTKPELLLRSGLHKCGFRYRLHARNLPGRPDLVFASRRAAIFVNGCFWHGHDCALFRLPGTRQDFWRAKIERNRLRDATVRARLEEMGWRHLTVWECSFRGTRGMGFERTLGKIITWLEESQRSAELRGKS